MYGRTNRLHEKPTRRQKHVMATVGGLVLLVFVGLGVWGVLAHDSFGQSGNGCINLVLPGATGGSALHFCGPPARSFCHALPAGQNPVSERARPACRAAGLLSATSSSP
jgi:hypothetical protein